MFYLIGNYINTSQIQNVQYWANCKNVVYLGQMINQTEEAKKILASMYRTTTALIFTSEMEGSPNTILEALGCNCPVIYNDAIDIVPEILGDSAIPIKNFSAIFEDKIRAELKQAMLPILPYYTVEVCVKKYLEILDASI
jgi:glycosyltransferase involved in cell wall biosynthesis